MGQEAIEVQNTGRARVCARRAVGTFVLTSHDQRTATYGNNAMAILRDIRADKRIPPSISQAAERLLGGMRSIEANELYSLHPLADAVLIITYFVESAERLH